MDGLPPDIAEAMLSSADRRRTGAAARTFIFNVTIANAVIHIGEPEPRPPGSDAEPHGARA